MGRVRVGALQTRGAVISIFMLACGVLAAITACGGGSNLAAAPDAAPATGLASLPPPSVLRQASYDPALLVCEGKDYMNQTGFPLQNVSEDGDCGEFTPNWSPEEPDAAGLAYACYGFELSDYDREQKISFTWDAAGDPADLWIGLADFASDRWSWHRLAGDGSLALDFTPYIDPGSSDMWIVPLAVGTAPWMLNRIQVGDLASLSGYVFEDDGETPVAGVSVTLSGDQDYAAQTGPDGRWSVIGVLFGEYEATVELFGWSFEPASQPLTVDSLEFAAADFIGTPLPRYEVRGYVQSTTGTAVGGTRVDITSAAGNIGSPYAISDDEGWWTLDLPDGNYTATPSKPAWRFLPTFRDFSVAGAETIVGPFMGQPLPGYPVTGFVFLADGSTPLADVEVTVSHTEFDLVYSATTDPSGFWALSEVIDGDYVVEPRLYGWSFTPPARDITVDGGGVDVDPFTGEELNCYTLDGYVYLQDGMVPLAGVDLELDYGLGTFSTATDATGHYEFPDIYEGSYLLTPSKLGYGFNPAQQSIELTGAKTAAPFFATLLPGHKVSGYIFKVDGITGVDGVTVTVESVSPPGASFQATTNLSGYWQVTSVPNASYSVTPQKPGYFFEPIAQFIEVNDADTVVEDFIGTPLPTYTISGFTVQTDGFSALPGVTVFVTGTFYSYEVVSDAAGHWQVDGVLEDNYHVVPMLAPWQFSPEFRDVTVSGGDLIVAPFIGEELQAWPVDGYIYKVLTTIPIAGVDVWFQSDTLLYRSTSDASGYYEIMLPMGDWTATPVSDDWDFSPTEQNFSMFSDPLTLEVFYGML